MIQDSQRSRDSIASSRSAKHRHLARRSRHKLRTSRANTAAAGAVTAEAAENSFAGQLNPALELPMGDVPYSGAALCSVADVHMDDAAGDGSRSSDVLNVRGACDVNPNMVLPCAAAVATDDVCMRAAAAPAAVAAWDEDVLPVVNTATASSMATRDDTGNHVCDALKAVIRVWSVSMVQTLTDALVSRELQRECAVGAIIARDCVLHCDGVAGSAGTDGLCWDDACAACAAVRVGASDGASSDVQFAAAADDLAGVSNDAMCTTVEGALSCVGVESVDGRVTVSDSVRAGDRVSLDAVLPLCADFVPRLPLSGCQVEL